MPACRMNSLPHVSFGNPEGLEQVRSRRGRRRRGGSVAVGLASLAVLTVVAVALVGTGAVGDLSRFGFGAEAAQPDLTAPNLPAPRPAVPVLQPQDGSTADPQAPAPTASGLARVLGPLLSARTLGSATGVVVDPGTGDTLYSRAATTPTMPASTAKIATSVAVLAAGGPDTRLQTAVVEGARAGEIVLVGGGDPTLTARPPAKGARASYPAPASLADLAAATARALQQAGTTSVRLRYDDFLFSGPPVSPAWEPTYVRGGSVAPITALTVDEGRLRPRTAHGTDPRSKNPSQSAAREFARLLTTSGVKVTGAPVRARAPEGAQRIAAVHSPPLSALVEQALTISDNDLAESLARRVAVAKGVPASFDGATTATRQVLQELGIDTAGMALYDGSGLSRRDRLPVGVLGQILATAASSRHPELRAVLTGLPVAGFSGTLEDRFDAGKAAAAAGVVRAKTGTLAGVGALAGVTRDADGRLLAFAFVADDVPAGGSDRARAALDRAAAALAACGCN